MKSAGVEQINSDGQKKDSLVDSVSISLRRAKFTVGELKDKVALTMSNKTNDPIMTGENYSIEHYENGQWKIIEAFKDLSFISIGYLIAPGQSKEFTIDFLGEKHQYVIGKYRVVKNYVMDKDIAPKTSYDLYCEFTVN